MVLFDFIIISVGKRIKDKSKAHAICEGTQESNSL